MTVRRASALSQPPSQPSLPPFGPSPTPPPPWLSPALRRVRNMHGLCTACSDLAPATEWLQQRRPAWPGRLAAGVPPWPREPGEVQKSAVYPQMSGKSPAFGHSHHSRENSRANKSTSIPLITTYVSLISTASEPTTRLHRHCTAHTD